MSDDDDQKDAPDPSVLRRREAQGAAGDLARMGIDPRSLGLGEPEPPPSAPEPPVDDRPDASVVPLRPGLVPPPAPPAPEPAPEQEVVAAPTRAEQLLGGTTAPVEPPAARQTSRLVRSVAKGLGTLDGAVAVQGERDLIDAVRHRQGDRRVVAFAAGKGGVGCTTVAVGVATALTALRDDDAVLVDVQQGTPSLGALHGVTEPRSVASVLADDQATSPPRTAGSVGLVDGAGWDQALSRRDVSGVLERLGTDHVFRLLDAGDDAGEGGHAALARADQVVVVSGPGEHGLAATTSALQRVRDVNPGAASRVVHVVVCPHEESWREAQKQSLGAAAAAGVVVLPPDPHLRAGQAYDPAKVAPETREALLRVAAAVAVGALR